MNEYFVLKDTTNGKYYSNDNVFIEPNKQFAKKLRKGQAQALMFNHNRWSAKPKIIMEPI